MLKTKEIFFLQLIETGAISINKQGIVFNNKTNRQIAKGGKNQYPQICYQDHKSKKIISMLVHRLV